MAEPSEHAAEAAAAAAPNAAGRISAVIVPPLAIFGIVVAALAVWLGLSGPPGPPAVVVSLPSSTGQPPGVEGRRAVVLAPAPDPTLVERVNDLAGPVPVTSPSGKTAWLTYGRPFDTADRRPRIAFIVDNLGTSASDTDAAIRTLPAPVSLAFMPYRKKLDEWIPLARAAGHEVLLDLPMEPADPRHNDPGPNAMRSALEPNANLTRLLWTMSQATGYVGFIGFMGDRFTTDRTDLQPVMAELRRRGLLFVDNRASEQSVAPLVAGNIGLPFAAAGRTISGDLTRTAVERRLQELEDLATRTGSAVGIGEGSPVVREALIAWGPTLESRGFALAPVSAVVSIVTPNAPAAPVMPDAPAAAPPPKG